MRGSLGMRRQTPPGPSQPSAKRGIQTLDTAPALMGDSWAVSGDDSRGLDAADAIPRAVTAAVVGVVAPSARNRHCERRVSPPDNGWSALVSGPSDDGRLGCCLPACRPARRPANGSPGCRLGGSGCPVWRGGAEVFVDEADVLVVGQAAAAASSDAVSADLLLCRRAAAAAPPGTAPASRLKRQSRPGWSAGWRRSIGDVSWSLWSSREVAVFSPKRHSARWCAMCRSRC